MTPSQEEWRPVVGYEGYYEVSDHGRVRSVTRLLPRGGGHFKRTGRVRAPQSHGPESNRRVVNLSKDGQVTTHRVASLVLIAFVGPRPQGMEACHGDGDCANDRLSNLRWDTRGANNVDAVKHGTHWQTRKTHCSQGHPLAEPNLTAFGLRHGWRRCLACGRARSDAHHLRRTGRDADFAALAAVHYRRIQEEARCPLT